MRLSHHEPEAREIFVAGSFNDWNPREHPLIRDASGNWSVELELPPGEYRYRLIIDGRWCDHANALRTAPNPYGGTDAICTVSDIQP
jgi:1,4-alpha-glucan branching enzyme